MIRSSASVPLSTAIAPEPNAPIKRSGGRVSDLSSIGRTDISRSSSGQSAFHLSSSASSGGLGTPGSARRRSTETSGSGGGLDYYWSNAAGIGPSSSSSSLAMSSSPSLGLVEPFSPASGERRKGLYRRSEASLRDLIAQEQRRADGMTDERLGGGVVELESPSWSGESDYSSSVSLPMDGIPPPGTSPRGQAQPVNVWNAAQGEYDHARQSMVSTSTTRAPTSPAVDGAVDHRTPVVAQTGDRPDIRPPGYAYNSDSLHATPIVSQTNFSRAQPSPSSYTPGSGRLDSAGIRRGGSSPSGPGSAGASPGDAPVVATEIVAEPQSAPPWQGEFGLGMGAVGGEEDTTIKSRGRDKRATLPAMPVDLAVELLSPEKRQKGSSSPQPPPRSALRTQLAGITSPLPNLLFDYNPSSVPRGTNSPLNISPPSRDIARLSLSSTPNSSPPMSREPSTDHPVHLPSRLRDPNDSMHSQGSINDLTELLGGAIDEIGLIDSRETPPPMVAADSRDKPRPGPLNLNSSSLAPAAVLGETEEGRRPITPGSLPSRGESLSSGTGSASGGSGSGMVPAPNPGAATSAQAEERYNPATATSNLHQRQTSTSTLHAPGSATAAGFANRPWPAAMLFGHIKNMKHSGDRAKYYAKGINDLALADSGLRDWCVISASSAHRVPPARIPLNRLQSNMTSRSDFAPSIHIQPALPSSLSSRGSAGQPSAHPRNVSSSSEFPMREDSYTAREISQRVIDPGDEPTSLPPNLPYPQLQQVRNGGMRSSPSVASMASMASTATATTIAGSSGGGGSGSSKRGFFSALRSKKDSGGLGPPTGPVGAGNGMGKKDVRGLPISNPERSSLSGPSPMGPRGPRMGGGSYPDPNEGRQSLDGATPYRGSLDGMSRLTPPASAGTGRSSFDSSQTQARAGVGVRLQQAAGTSGNMPKEEDVRAMQDVLPHVDRGVLRAYLSKYGDQMSAITAYFEDEKRGPMRA